MKTSKPISTISYNTAEFLESKIAEWRELGIIEFAMWIRHKAEEGEKDHWHVYLQPAKMVQTMDLEKLSCEIDPNNDLPLKMVRFQNSKETDWLLYSLHDKAYLAGKGLNRIFHYDISDINSTDDDVLRDIITHMNDERKGSIETRIFEACRMGLTWYEVVASGIVPLRYMIPAKILYETLEPVIKGDGLRDLQNQ